MPTSLQIAQGRQIELSAGLLMVVRTEAPLFSAFDARTTSGTSFLSLAVISLPSSSFANLGEGFLSSEGEMELRRFDCSLIGGLVKSEKITTDLWNKEHPGLDWFAIQAELKAKADILNIERQMIKGRANDSKGFPGAKDMTPFITGNVLSMTGSSQALAFKPGVINVGGSTASTASSVYSFVFGETESQLVWGSDSGGELFTLGEIKEQAMAPDSNQPSRMSDHYYAQLRGFVGLAVSGMNLQAEGQTVPTQYSVRRAANVTGDNGYGLTDAVMDKLKRSHGTGRTPNLFAMSQRSGEQLAKSRQPTAVNFVMGQSGDAQSATYSTYPAPPDNYNGIPIVYPDCIVDNDAIEVAA